MNYLVFLIASACSCLALAQAADRLVGNQRDPDWPIVLVVPFPPGGSATKIGSILAAGMADAMKRTVTPRNIPTGMGVDALNAITVPVSDEIRVGYATNTGIVTGALIAKGANYNPMEDFDWIGVAGTFGNAMIVGPQANALTFDHWMASLAGRDRPLRIGAGAPGSISMLAARFYSKTVASPVQFVSFSSADEGYPALKAGAIDVFFDGLPNALEETQKIGGRIVAVTTKERISLLPEAMAFGERWPGEDYSVFVALVVSKKETEMIRARLKSGWYGVTRDAKVRSELEKLGLRYLGLDLEAAGEFAETQFLRHARELAKP
jgi:tripartite-type tricarboxylate transporter receptor subunit TctC